MAILASTDLKRDWSEIDIGMDGFPKFLESFTIDKLALDIGIGLRQ